MEETIPVIEMNSSYLGGDPGFKSVREIIADYRMSQRRTETERKSQEALRRYPSINVEALNACLV